MSDIADKRLNLRKSHKRHWELPHRHGSRVLSSGTWKYITHGTWRKFPLVPANRFGVQFGKEIGFPITMRRWLSCDCHLADRRRDGTKEADTGENAPESISSQSKLPPSRFFAKAHKIFSRSFLPITVASLLPMNYRFTIIKRGEFRNRAIKWNYSCLPHVDHIIILVQEIIFTSSALLYSP